VTGPIELEAEVARHNAALIAEAAHERLLRALWPAGRRTSALATRRGTLARSSRTPAPCCASSARAAQPVCCPA
jgi:hypothetical protein